MIVFETGAAKTSPRRSCSKINRKKKRKEKKKKKKKKTEPTEEARGLSLHLK
jgi:hypothetical protein